MAKKFIQTSFNAGELAEQLAGRVDFKKYFNGLSTMLNFIPLKQGGAEKRPGLEFVVEAKGKARLLPFEFSVEDTVMVEMGEEYMRFLTDEGQTEIASPIEDEDFVVLNTYKWFESSSGYNEYYCATPLGADPSITEPYKFYEQSILLTKGTLGSLNRGEWGYGDNDTLGFNTIYVRLTLRA